MRIGVLHLGRTGAGPLLALQLSRALAAAGVDVATVSSADAEVAAEFAALPTPTLAVPTFRTSAQSLTRLVRLPALARRITAFFREQDVDVIVVVMEQVWQALMAPHLQRSGIPILLCVHDGEIHPGEYSAVAEALRRRERRAADGALVFSQHVRDTLTARGPFPEERIWQTVHPALELDTTPRPRTLPTDRPVVVGFFGRMSRYKGLQLGVEAVTALRARGARVVFRVVGRDIPADVAATGHPDDDFRDQWTPQDDVEAVIAGFDILLLPYTESSQSGVIGYAIALGIPTVVTPVGGLIEQADDSGAALIADDLTPAAIADALGRLLTDAELYRELSRNALHASSESFSWPRVANDVIIAARALRDAES